MVKTTFYLEEETALALKRLASARGRSQADLIREALRQYTSDAGRPMPKGFGAYRSGRAGISERAEELLRKAARRPR